MKKNTISATTSVIMLLMVGCSLAELPTVTAPAILPASPTATPDPEPAVSPTPSLSPTATPTPTPSVPVFDPDAIGDNRLLESFILTRKDVTTGGGTVETRQETAQYIRASSSASYVGATSDGSGFYFQYEPHYLIDGGLYEKIGRGPWFYFFHPEPHPSELEPLQEATDMRQGAAMLSHLIESAQFIGQEDYQGIPANHFALDLTNIGDASDPTGTYQIQTAQGELFLAQDGNYLLYVHIKLTGNLYWSNGSGQYAPGTREITEGLASIDQVTQITLPADYPAYELDLGLPLPSGVILDSILHSSDGRRNDTYMHFMPVSVSPEDFYAFYRDLAQTNGWAVESIGRIDNLYSCQSQDCVTLKRGNAKIIVYLPAACESDMPANHVCVAADYYR